MNDVHGIVEALKKVVRMRGLTYAELAKREAGRVVLPYHSNNAVVVSLVS